jgi:hypothetical protein
MVLDVTLLLLLLLLLLRILLLLTSSIRSSSSGRNEVFFWPQKSRILVFGRGRDGSSHNYIHTWKHSVSWCCLSQSSIQNPSSSSSSSPSATNRQYTANFISRMSTEPTPATNEPSMSADVSPQSLM